MGGIAACEPESFFREAIDIGSDELLTPVAVKIAVTKVVTQDDDEIGWRCCRAMAGE